jgi:regulator of RNase E activity RraA
MTIGPDTLRIARTVRTSDVADALDSMGMQERFQMDASMRPLYPGIRFAGVAHPMAYERIDRPIEPMSYDDFARLQYAPGPEGLWKEAGPWGAPDEVLVIDAKRAAAGILGSANTLEGRIKGTVGFVIDGACRDSYECTIQRTPAFCTVRSPAHPMGRLRAASDGEPMTCAGVEVRAGDLVVADDDGVMVVPHEMADEAMDRARRIQEADRPGRQEAYRRLGLPLDATVGVGEGPGDVAADVDRHLRESGFGEA